MNKVLAGQVLLMKMCVQNGKNQSTKRVKMRTSLQKLGSMVGAIQKYQYFSRSHSQAQPLLVIYLLGVCFLQLLQPCCSEKNQWSRSKIGNEDTHLVNSLPRDSEHTYDGKYDDNVDVVGYGEDCSSEGPYCDKSRNFACDPIEEVCVCDWNNGYIHVKDIPGGMEQHLLYGTDEHGNPYVDPTSKVCISKQEIIERTDELLGLMQKEEASNVKVPPVSETLSEYSSEREEIEMLFDDERERDVNIFSDPDAAALNDGEERNSIINKLMSYVEQPDYDEKRLERFKLTAEFGKTTHVFQSEKDLIMKEILKYQIGPVAVLDEIKPHLKTLLNIHFKWKSNTLFSSICSSIFDVDRDEIFTPQEYAIAVLSEKVRQNVMPRVFLDLIQSLVEENCISEEDLRVLEHDPDTLPLEFRMLDLNHDGCFSFEEFSQFANHRCGVNWLTDFLKTVDLDSIFTLLDPSPEEMFIRRLMQDARLASNWKMVDKDNDGFLSYDELDSDFNPTAFVPKGSNFETDSLMHYLDKNNDNRVSMKELKLQISNPEITEWSQLEWLESLYELYETDENDVNEYTEDLNRNYYNEEILHVDPSMKINETKKPQETGMNRIFTIFDKNRNGDLDKVEYKLLLEMMRKYIVYDLLNQTIELMDLDNNGKITHFEYLEFFTSTQEYMSNSYLRSLLAVGKEGDDDDDIGNSGIGEEVSVDEDANEYEEVEEENTDEDEEAPKTITLRVSKKAAATNLTIVTLALFKKLDDNEDGVISKEDFYAYASSFKAKHTDDELREEFDRLDKDNDGVLTANDSEDYGIPLDFESFKEANTAFSEDISLNRLEKEFSRLDQNWDGIIQREELSAGRRLLFEGQDYELFLKWIEQYLATTPEQVDKGGEQSFMEFDTNCDRFISADEFIGKVQQLRNSSKEIAKLAEDPLVYFQNLDLNRDGLVSYNEFHLLLLRKGKTLNNVT